MKRPVLLSFLLSIIGFFLFLQGCYTVPVTGRSALNMVDEGKVIEMSKQAFETIKRQNRISRDPGMNAMVQRVGSNISDAVFADIPDAEWEFVVFDDPGSINAFAMPGGKIGVFSGLFKVVITDDDLGVVLGHEIAHVSAKHTHERLSKQMLLESGGSVLGIASGGYGSLTQSAVLSVYGLGATASVAGFTRYMEGEADYIGLLYTARAGYDPRAAIELWERMDMESAGKPVPPAWMSTHPSRSDRMVQLNRAMPEAVAEYEYYKAMAIP